MVTTLLRNREWNYEDIVRLLSWYPGEMGMPSQKMLSTCPVVCQRETMQSACPPELCVIFVVVSWIDLHKEPFSIKHTGY